MLAMTMRYGEKLFIGGATVKVEPLTNHQYRVYVDAPRETSIVRESAKVKIQRERDGE